MNYYITTTGATTIVQLPLAFVRSGYIYPPSGAILNVSANGYSWSKTSKSSTSTYDLGIHPDNANPSDSSNRYDGFPPPLPCLKPMEEWR